MWTKLNLFIIKDFNNNDWKQKRPNDRETRRIQTSEGEEEQLIKQRRQPNCLTGKTMSFWDFCR